MIRSGLIRDWSSGITVSVLALVLVAAVLSVLMESPFLLFLPVAILVVAVLGPRTLTTPALMLSFFLFLAVDLDFFKIPGTGITLDVVLSIVLVWVLIMRSSLEGRRLIQGPVCYCYLLFLAVGLISVFLSVSPLGSAKRWGRELEYLLLFSFLAAIPLTLKEKKHLVGAVILSSILPCLVGLLSLCMDTSGVMRGHYLDVGKTEMRITALLSHPVTLALYLGLTGTLTLSFLLARKWFSHRLLLPIFILQMLVLFLTFGRTGWLAFAASALVLLWLRGHRRWPLLVVPILVLGLLVVVPAFKERMATALQEGKENSLIWRFGLWAHALEMFPARPIFGSGLGTFTEYVSYGVGFGAHQTWLGLLVETGIVGVLAFLLLMMTLGRSLWRKYRSCLPGSDPLLEAVLAIWVGLMVGSITAGAFGLPSVVVYLWALAGIALHSATEERQA